MKLVNNFSRIILVLLIVLLSTNSSFSNENKMKAQIKYITELNGTKEYKLPNGLKVLLKPNHSIPLVTFSVWYKVGSRNEKKGIYGLAHFLEHMMFKGTKKYKKGQISEIIQKHGGVFNAFTSSDGTAYYETISPKYLEKVIEIESDRMKNSSFDEGELNLERNVVLSELEGDLNNPATHLDHKLRQVAYEISPYKHPTIGYEEDIKNINSKIMRDFYKKFYNPCNATIILVGDFNENYALTLIKKYLGQIKNDSLCEYESIPRDDLQKREKKFKVERPGTFKLLEIAYHIPDVKNSDIYPLNIIEEILIRGKKSPLDKALVEKGLATEIYGGAEANTDPGLFYILVSLTPKATHKKVETIIINEINKLIKNPPSNEEITAAKNRLKAQYFFNLDGTYAQALNIGYFEIINNWKQSSKWIEEISKVTQEDVLNALKNYFQKSNRTIGYFIPKLRKGEKYEPTPLSLSKTQHYTKTPTASKTTAPSKTQSPINYVDYKKFKYKKSILSDGSELLLYKNIDLPITYITGIIKGGSSLVPKENEWYCELISRTLEKGSKKYTKEQIESILDSTGSTIQFSCDNELFKFSIVSLNDNLIKTIELLSDILMNPVFPKEEVINEKNKLIAETIELKDNTAEISRRKLSQIIYQTDHPYYQNDLEKELNLLKKINTDKLPEIHEKIIKNNKAIISFITKLDEKDLDQAIKTLEDRISDKKIKIDPQVNIPDTSLRDTPKTETVFLRGKYQSDVFLGHAGDITRNDPDFYKILVANYILGGSSLASRLSKTIRDNEGLVYTIYSYVSATLGKGEIAIYFGSNNDNVNKAIELIKKEVKDFVKSGITEDELRTAKNSLIDSFIARNLSTYRDISNTLVTIKFYGLGDNYINDYPKIINSLKLSEINSAIKKHFFPDKLNIAIAGEYKKEDRKNVKVQQTNSNHRKQ